MFRRCLGLLVLLGVGEHVALAQPLPPPASVPPTWFPVLDTAGEAKVLPPPAAQEKTPAKAPATTPDPSKNPAGQACQSNTGTGSSQQTGQQTNQQTTQQTTQQSTDADFRRNHSGPCERFWVSGGFLLWWTRSGPPAGPLVTTGGANAGILGSSDTRVLYGNDRFDFPAQPGVALEAGAWLDDCHQWGFMAAGFLLERESAGTQFQSDAAGNPLLARPFVNAISGQQSSVNVAAPGVAIGGVGISQNTQLWGAEADAVRNLVNTPNCSVNMLAGFRYLDLTENLNVFETSTLLSTLSPLQPAGQNQTIADRFTTRNQLYLGQVGSKFEWWRGPLFVSLTGKVGLGPDHQHVGIAGSTTTTLPGANPVSFPGGLLAVPGTAAVRGGNVGVHTTNWFDIVPEIALEVGLNVTDHMRLSVGYNFLYINEVARPGSQVNPIINPSLVPSSLAFGSPSGSGQPRALTTQEDFWAQGVRFMVQIRY